MSTNPSIETGATSAGKANVAVRFFHALMSFVVGLAAFFVFKALFMVPVNLMTTEKNIDLMQGLGAILFLVSIYLAIRYTKKLNAAGTPKTRLVKRIATLIVGFIAMALSNVALLLGQVSR